MISRYLLTHACRSTVHGKASTKAKAMVRTFSLINQQINTSAQKDTNVNNIVTDQINANFSHWATVPLGPPDGILGLNQAFSADSNPVPFYPEYLSHFLCHVGRRAAD